MLDLKRYEVLVLGASAGGVEALNRVFRALPPEPRLPVACVLHIPASAPFVARAFGTAPGYDLREADDKDRLAPGIIYFAPPDYHLLLEGDGTISLSVEEPEHFARPSIDVLFESAARAYGDRVLAMLLTGANADGARGLAEIRRRGGTTLVQDPATASSPTMPQAAIDLGAAEKMVNLSELEALFKPRDALKTMAKPEAGR